MLGYKEIYAIKNFMLILFIIAASNILFNVTAMYSMAHESVHIVILVLTVVSVVLNYLRLRLSLR